MTRLHVIMTSFNRRDTTLRCIESLRGCEVPDGIEIAATLVDASSPDDTAAAVRIAHPEVKVVQVPSNVFWAQGMRIAWESAAESEYDAIIWLNDDVVLDRGAILKLLSASNDYAHSAIVVGSMRDPESGAVTYAGLRLGTGLNRLNMPRVEPKDVPVECDTFNGNLVLVPRSVDQRLGGFPRGYSHGLADHSFGLHARREAIPVVLAAGTLGTCARNSQRGTWQDSALPAKDRFRLLRSPKGLPWSPWIRYCWRFGGILGVLSGVKPYVRLGVGSLVALPRRVAPQR